MIADVTSPGHAPEHQPGKAPGRRVEGRAGDHDATPIPSESTGAELAAEHDLFTLAFRKFEALLPGIEALTTDVV